MLRAAAAPEAYSHDMHAPALHAPPPPPPRARPARYSAIFGDWRRAALALAVGVGIGVATLALAWVLGMVHGECSDMDTNWEWASCLCQPHHLPMASLLGRIVHPIYLGLMASCCATCYGAWVACSVPRQGVVPHRIPAVAVASGVACAMISCAYHINAVDFLFMLGISQISSCVVGVTMATTLRRLGRNGDRGVFNTPVYAAAAHFRVAALGQGALCVVTMTATATAFLVGGGLWNLSVALCALSYVSICACAAMVALYFAPALMYAPSLCLMYDD